MRYACEMLCLLAAGVAFFFVFSLSGGG